MPCVENNASMSAVLVAGVYDSGNGILPSNKRKTVNSGNLEEAFVVCLVPVLNRFHCEDKHIEDIGRLLLQNRYRLPLNNPIRNSNDWSVTEIIRNSGVSAIITSEEMTSVFGEANILGRIDNCVWSIMGRRRKSCEKVKGWKNNESSDIGENEGVVGIYI